MGADSKNQRENMCCQHKKYDIIEVKNLNTLQHEFGKQKGRFYEFYNTGYDADSRNQI